MDSNLICCFLVISGVVIIQINATSSQSKDKFQQGGVEVEGYSMKSNKNNKDNERKDKSMKPKGKVTTEDVGMKSRDKIANTNEEKKIERFRMKAEDNIVKTKPEKKMRNFGKPKGKLRKTKQEKAIKRFSMKSKDNNIKKKPEKKMKDFRMKPKWKTAKVGEKEGKGYKMKLKESHLGISKDKLSKMKAVISQRKKTSPTDNQRELRIANVQLSELKRLIKQLKTENRILKQMVSSKPITKSLADNTAEPQRLKALLKASKAENKRLKKQNKRQKLIWFALQQMCKALEGKSQEKGSSSNKSLEREHNVTKVDTNQNTTAKDFNIQPLSVSSRSLRGGNTEIQVEFRASSPRPAVDWFVNLPYGGFYRTGGKSEYKAANNTYLASLVVSHSSSRPLVYFRIYDGQDYLEIHLDQRAINDTKHEIFNPVEILIEGPKAPIVAPDDKSLNASFYVNCNINLTQNGYIDALFRGVNTTVSPSEMFQIGKGRYRGVNRTTSEISGTRLSRLHVSVEITENLAKYGGILSIEAIMSTDNIVPVPKQPGLISRIIFGTTFKVLSPSTETVVLPNSIALSVLPDVTLLASPSQSVSCLAMGDPRPEITLGRDTKGGWKELEPHQILTLDEFSTIKTFLIDASDAEVEGRYICSASNAITTVTSMTEVIIHEPATIDDDASGLTINSSNKIEISCQASGKPAPSLELRLYNEWGPDIARSSKYEVSRSHPDSRTSALQVTISPVDTDIYRLYCYATNSDYYQKPTLLIDVFPEPSTGYNWDLYNEVQGYI